MSKYFNSHINKLPKFFHLKNNTPTINEITPALSNKMTEKKCGVKNGYLRISTCGGYLNEIILSVIKGIDYSYKENKNIIERSHKSVF